jgi:hypothetical protein
MGTLRALTLLGLLLAACGSSKSGGASSRIDCAAFAGHMIDLTRAAAGLSDTTKARLSADDAAKIDESLTRQRDSTTKMCERQQRNPEWAPIYDCVMKADALQKASDCMLKK